jgi:WD40 repeat protein
VIDGKPVVACACRDGRIPPWDARSGSAWCQLLIGSTNAVALGEIDGEPVVVSGGEDHTVRLWDARSGSRRGKARAMAAS